MRVAQEATSPALTWAAGGMPPLQAEADSWRRSCRGWAVSGRAPDACSGSLAAATAWLLFTGLPIARAAPGRHRSSAAQQAKSAPPAKERAGVEGCRRDGAGCVDDMMRLSRLVVPLWGGASRVRCCRLLCSQPATSLRSQGTAPTRMREGAVSAKVKT